MGYLLNILSRFLETTIGAFGGHVTLSLSGILFLGFPASLWAGAYGYTVAAKGGLTTSYAVGAGILLAALFGILFAYLYARVSDDGFAVVTLASVLATESLLRSWDAITGGVLGISGVPRIISGQTLKELATFEFFVVGVTLILYWFLLQSPFGRSLRALKESKTTLTSLGTSATLIGQTSIVLASLFSGVAGILAATRIQFLDPSLGGIPFLIQILTIAIITNSPRVAQLLSITLVIVLVPEAFRLMDLPVAIIGHLRNILYSGILIALIYFSLFNQSSKRYV